MDAFPYRSLYLYRLLRFVSLHLRWQIIVLLFLIGTLASLSPSTLSLSDVDSFSSVLLSLFGLVVVLHCTPLDCYCSDSP